MLALLLVVSLWQASLSQVAVALRCCLVASGGSSVFLTLTYSVLGWWVVLCLT